jgi:hypothetical protein
MKKFAKAFWAFFEAWGEYRYKLAKKNGYMIY